jgi:hypothetical protein
MLSTVCQELNNLCLLLILLQDNAAVLVANGTVFRDNSASYGGGIGESWLQLLSSKTLVMVLSPANTTCVCRWRALARQAVET